MIVLKNWNKSKLLIFEAVKLHSDVEDTASETCVVGSLSFALRLGDAGRSSP